MFSSFTCRRYQELTQDRLRARQQWRSRHPARSGVRAPNYPPELAEYAQFPEWFKQAVEIENASGDRLDEILIAISKFPSTTAQKFRSLYAYGSKLRVQSAE